jgi:hypothetical protein
MRTPRIWLAEPRTPMSLTPRRWTALYFFSNSPGPRSTGHPRRRGVMGIPSLNTLAGAMYFCRVTPSREKVSTPCTLPGSPAISACPEGS